MKTVAIRKRLRVGVLGGDLKEKTVSCEPIDAVVFHLKKSFEPSPSASRNGEVIELSGGGCNWPDCVRVRVAMVMSE